MAIFQFGFNAHSAQQAKHIDMAKVLGEHAGSHYHADQGKNANGPLDILVVSNQEPQQEKGAQGVPQVAELIDHRPHLRVEKNKSDGVQHSPGYEELVEVVESAGNAAGARRALGNKYPDQAGQDNDPKNKNVKSAHHQLLPQRNQESDQQKRHDQILAAQAKHQHDHEQHRNQHKRVQHRLLSTTAEFEVFNRHESGVWNKGSLRLACEK